MHLKRPAGGSALLFVSFQSSLLIPMTRPFSTFGMVYRSTERVFRNHRLPNCASAFLRLGQEWRGLPRLCCCFQACRDVFCVSIRPQVLGSALVAASLTQAFQNLCMILVLISDFFHLASRCMPLLPASMMTTICSVALSFN